MTNRSHFRILAAVAALLLASRGVAQILPPLPGASPAMEDYVRWANIDKFIEDAGGTFDTAVFNDAVQQCDLNNWHTLYFPPGTYVFDAPPTSIGFALNIRGAGNTSTYFHKDFDVGGSALLQFTGGTSTAPEQGGGVRDLTIAAISGTAPSIAIAATASAAAAPDHLIFRNVVVVGPGSWYSSLQLNGLGRASAPFGIQDVLVDNCHFQGNTTGAIVATAVVDLEVRGGGMYGAMPSSNIYVGGSSTHKSRQVRIRTNLHGELNLTNCEEVFVNGGYGRINSDSTANYVWVNAYKRLVTPDIWAISTGRLQVINL